MRRRNPLLLEYFNPPRSRVVAKVPGTLEEIRYHRSGRHRGPYKHAYRTPADLYGLENGGLLALPKDRQTTLWNRYGGQVWLDNVPRRAHRDSRARFVHEDIAAVPRGWRVRTVSRKGHRVRIAFPPGPRRRGAGRLISILHPPGENPRRCNPAYSAYFVGRGGKISERYFRARNLTDARRQSGAYAAARGLQPSTLWQLRHATRVGRRYAGEWAHPLEGRNPMARDRYGRFLTGHRRRRRHNDPDPARRHRRRRGYYSRHRSNPRHGGYRRRHNPVEGVAQVLTHPGEVLTSAALGLGGLYGVIVAGNFLGSFFPTMYQDVTITGKVVRLVTRGAIVYVVDRFTTGMAVANRAALRIGAAVGVLGSFVLDLIGTSFSIGAGDQTETVAGVLQPVGVIPAATAGAGAYVAPFRRPHTIAGTGAYLAPRQHQFVSGLGAVALDMGDSLLYNKMR